MAKATWVGGSSNNFNDKKNWSPQTVPGATSDVIIAPATATAIIAANDTVNSLTTNANVSLSIAATDTFTIIDKATADNPTGTSTNGGALSLGAAADLFLSGTFDNTGVLTTQATSDVWVAGKVVNSGVINQQGDFNVGNAATAGTIVETAGAHWTITGNVDVSGGGAAGSRLSNAGDLTRTGAGITDIGVATINSGTVLASGGTLEFLSSVTNTGTMSAAGAGTALWLDRGVGGTGSLGITDGASLHLLRGADSGQTVHFAGNGALDLGAPGVFAGLIAGFGAHDLIDLLHAPATGVSFANGVLKVQNGAATVASLHLAGSYTSANFRLTTDNHGGTLIHYV
jgi:hypothetical protein